MIRPLRRAHRFVMLAVAVALPLLLAAAVAFRQPVPIQRPWPLAMVR